MAKHLNKIGALAVTPCFVDEVNPEDYTLKQLRTMFPSVKATSKKAFIKALSYDS